MDDEKKLWRVEILARTEVVVLAATAEKAKKRIRDALKGGGRDRGQIIRELTEKPKVSTQREITAKSHVPDGYLDAIPWGRFDKSWAGKLHVGEILDARKQENESQGE